MSQKENITKKETINQIIKTNKIEFIEKNLPKLIKYCKNYLQKLKEIRNFVDPNKLEDFSPVILSKEDDKHSELINNAVDNPNVINLALTGSLGSGKSSILKTFEYNYYLQHKCLDISLATFDEINSDPEKTKIEKIEYNILKQLFYSVEHKKIPESRFKRIENHTGILWKTTFFILWITSLSYFLNFEYFDELKKALFINYHYKFLSFVYGSYFIIYLICLIHKLMNFVINFKMTKFKFKDVDFDNNQDKKTINFENEIDEILYFFEKTTFDVVFIQDLDRFNSTEIFIKLREISNLINNYEPIKKSRKVTFIYAVADNIFKESERAKFFDLIIPVIPVINYTSSSSKLLLKLDSDIIDGNLSKDFIEDVSRFLNDYRTIKSICNEYTLYKKIINPKGEKNNLLAMMIYKNIEPTDFENLNINRGYVYNVIDKSNDLIDERIEIYDDKIQKLKTNLEAVKNEKLKNVNELRMLYVLKFCELVLDKQNLAIFAFNLKNLRHTIEQTLSNEIFDLLRRETDIKFYSSTYNSTTYSGISFNQIEKIIDVKSYSERLAILKNSEKENLNQIRIELSEIENKKQELNSKKLFELLDDKNSETYFEKFLNENKKVNNIKLINYLISNGYINEDYNHYVSYFHPGSITKEDNDFLISLLPSEKSLSYKHKLNEVKSLIKQIKPENYNRESILNFSFIDYLIEKKEISKLNSITSLLKKGNKKSIKFIDEYLAYSNENNKSDFLKILMNNWNEIWSLIKSDSEFPEEKIETYLKYIFKYLDTATVEKIDKQQSLSNHISKLKNLDCFYSNDINIDRVKKFIENSEIKFENLEFKKEHKTLFEYIYDKNNYVINEKMITLFISNFNQNGTDIKNLKTANYTTIKNSGKPKLVKYLDDNLDVYIENVFLTLKDNFNESQETLCSFINNKLTNNENLIEKGNFIIEDISKIIDKESQSLLITNQRIKTNWENLITYYKKSKVIDEIICGYLNLEHIYNFLSKLPLINDPDENIKKSFSKDLIKSDVSDVSFSKLTNNLPFSYKDGNEFIGISEAKMKSLIQSKTILLSNENYNLINDEFNNILIILLEKNTADFIKTIEEYELENSIILEIINSKIFSIPQKLLIIELIEDSVLVENKTLLIKLSEFLQANKINKISSDLLAELISSSDSLKNKVELTNKYFSSIKTNNLRKIILKIGDPYSKLLLNKHPKVENTSYNQELIRNLSGILIKTPKPTKDNKQIELFPFTIPKI